MISFCFDVFCRRAGVALRCLFAGKLGSGSPFALKGSDFAAISNDGVDLRRRKVVCVWGSFKFAKMNVWGSDLTKCLFLEVFLFLEAQ